MINCSISLYRSFLLPLLFLGVYPLFANDCGCAITLDISPAASKYTCSSPASGTFSGGCDQLYTVPSAGCIDPSICGQDLWFQFNPLDGNFPTNQYNMIFELSFSGMSNPDQIRYYLLYAEATNSPNGDDCAWDVSNIFSQVFTQRASGCWNISAAAMDTSFIAHGLDGSGTFFLVLETAFGTGGSVDVCLKYDPDLPLSDTTCAPPSNDRASNATTMVVGSGIDSQAGVGGANSWAESITGTNQCATKQRMQNECIGGSAGNTEDHFYTSLFSCITDNCIGDQFFFGVRSGRCVGTNELLDNTVFFTFQRPPADPAGGWYLNIGNISCPTQGPDSITVIIADTFNIADAQSTTLLTCGNFGATGLIRHLPAFRFFPA